ncbi:MAG TPA: mandelate racemase/muconate lactonizing enzyme family protein [Burkholderiales bacterium]|jgi:galactonate dehydratase|nr:mandelate racemase/muconate lactonizing enzyme family protein [Burkholderiales bacterium]
MRIAGLAARVFNVSPKTNWCLLEVETDDGLTGWGEASLNGWEPMLVAATALRADELAGMELHAAQERLRPAPRSPGGLVMNAITSALQQAIAAIDAESNSIPVWALLGKQQRTSVPAYANINRATTDRSPAGFAATAREAMAAGFTAFKAAPFDGVTPANCAGEEGRALIAAGIERVLALRDAVGPEARLMVDCHWRFDEARAIDTLRALDAAKLFWFECPMNEAPDFWPAYQRIRAAAHAQGVRIAAAETQVGAPAFQAMFDSGIVDAVMPDIKYCGGPREMLAIAESAEQAGVLFSPHNPTGPVCTTASLHVAAIAPQCDLLEFQFGESPLYYDLLGGTHPLLENGAFTVPAEPGLGITIDIETLEAHPYAPVPFGIESKLAG